jgi:chromosome segregation ATPase
MVQATVLLIDGDTSEGGTEALRELIERAVDLTRWQVLWCPDIETAHGYFAKSGSRRNPGMLVLNVDVRGGWPFCTHIKKTYPTIPVLVVSRRLSVEVFQSHQKLDSRADAYHRLPDEEQALSISLSYFSSHESEVGRATTGVLRTRPRRAVTEPQPGPLEQLEQTVAHQARALEDARRAIEALEAERDAMAEQHRRLMRDYAAAGPGEEQLRLIERIAALDAELNRREVGVDDGDALRAALSESDALVERQRAQLDALQSELEAERRANLAKVEALEAERLRVEDKLAASHGKARAPILGLEDLDVLEAARTDARQEAAEAREQLAVVSVQLASLTAELKQAHERRLEAEATARELEQVLKAGAPLADAEGARRAEVERALADSLERNATLESALETLRGELAGLTSERQGLEEALQTSRRLMREYASDAARKAIELEQLGAQLAAGGAEGATSELQARVAELEEAFGAAQARVAELEQELGARGADGGQSATIADLEAEIAGFERQLFAAAEQQRAMSEQLAGLSASHAAEVERLGDELTGLREAAAAERARLEGELGVATARVESAERARGELSIVVADLRGEHDALRARHAEVEAAYQALEARVGIAEASHEADVSVIEKRRRELEEAIASREALEGYLVLVSERFQSVVDYARRLEGRLGAVETARMSTEMQLESLLERVRQARPEGEVPPALALPAR